MASAASGAIGPVQVRFKLSHVWPMWPVLSRDTRASITASMETRLLPSGPIRLQSSPTSTRHGRRAGVIRRRRLQEVGNAQSTLVQFVPQGFSISSIYELARRCAWPVGRASKMSASPAGAGVRPGQQLRESGPNERAPSPAEAAAVNSGNNRPQGILIVNVG